MKKILFINSVYNIGSTGKILNDLAEITKKNSFEPYLVYGRTNKTCLYNHRHIGNKITLLFHVLITRIFDKHGLINNYQTKKLIEYISDVKPDIIHLHNIHGYFINYKKLFDYLSKTDIPIVWTLHDCWTYTGHCAYYSFNKCDKWITSACSKCSNKKSYPRSYVFSDSKNNFLRKKESFLKIKNITFITPSFWLKNELSKSFFSNYPAVVINNGIDLSIFRPIATIKKDNIILGVANMWEERKGLKDFFRLSTLISDKYRIVLIGLNKKQLSLLPNNILGIEKTANQIELAEWYTKALVFVNPTYEDNFPTTNLEALACGTPVITYNTGGSPEAIDEKTGFVVEQGDIEGVYSCICEIEAKGKDVYSGACVARAKEKYDKNLKYQEYIDLYKSILNCQK